jgi:hypothetical protein
VKLNGATDMFDEAPVGTAVGTKESPVVETDDSPADAGVALASMARLGLVIPDPRLVEIPENGSTVAEVCFVLS